MTKEQLISAFYSDESTTRVGKHHRVMKVGPESIEPAAEIVFDSDNSEELRSYAIKIIAALVAHSPSRCREFLLGALSDTSPIVISQALIGLTAFHDEVTRMCISGHLADHRHIPHTVIDPSTVGEQAEWCLWSISESAGLQTKINLTTPDSNTSDIWIWNQTPHA